LWKHTDWRTGEAHSRRSRRLVISFIATIANYDYGFFWHLYEDGHIELMVKLTGIVSASLLTSSNRKFGVAVAPELTAVTHQHFFGARLDFTVDGVENSVMEVEVVAESSCRHINPHANGMYHTERLLTTEKEAIRETNPLSARAWHVSHFSHHFFLFVCWNLYILTKLPRIGPYFTDHQPVQNQSYGTPCVVCSGPSCQCEAFCNG
jgi:primary-amine oxidase